MQKKHQQSYKNRSNFKLAFFHTNGTGMKMIGSGDNLTSCHLSSENCHIYHATETEKINNSFLLIYSLPKPIGMTFAKANKRYIQQIKSTVLKGKLLLLIR